MKYFQHICLLKSDFLKIFLHRNSCQTFWQVRKSLSFNFLSMVRKVIAHREPHEEENNQLLT